MFKKQSRGQIQIGAVGVVVGLIASVGAPFLWAGDIKAKDAVQDVKILTLEETTKETKDNIKEVNKKIDALLWKNGINPEKIK